MLDETSSPYRLASKNEIVWQRPAGSVIGAALFAAFILASVALAIFNLAQSDGLQANGTIPSVLWLCLVSVTNLVWLWSDGVSVACKELLGGIVRNRFLLLDDDTSDQPMLVLGFRFRGKRLRYWALRLDEPIHVSWGAGQGSDMSGRDMDDWSVHVWHERKSAELKEWINAFHTVDDGLSRQQAVSFGQDLIRFLKENGHPVSLPPPGLVGCEGEVVKATEIGRVEARINGETYPVWVSSLDTPPGALIRVAKVVGSRIYADRVDQPAQT